MLITSAVFTLLAAALHVFIWYVEVFAWRKPLARKIFGPQAPDELAVTSFYAYNQGMYNLALAVVACVGAVMVLTTPSLAAVGYALSLAGCGSMLFAALSLGIASAKHRLAAVKQGLLPLLSVVCTLIVLL